MVTSLGAIVAALTLFTSPALAADPEDAAQPADGPTVHAGLKLEEDGTLLVEEQISVPEGEQMTRTQPLRVPGREGAERVYTVRDQQFDGNGSVEVADEELRVTAGEGESTVSYAVEGAVEDQPGEQAVRWQIAGGWDADLAAVTGSFSWIEPQVGWGDCFVGPPGSTQPCDMTQIAHGDVPRMSQGGLAAGERIDVVMLLPEGSVPANAVYEEVLTLTRAFAFTSPVVAGFGLLGLGALAAAAFLVFARRRDAASLAADGGTVDVLVTEGDRVFFASPDGVLPGQVGTVIDESVDPVDIAGTIVDLAVRNYLWVAEIAGPDDTVDWQISRRNPPDEQLHDYEKVLYETLLTDGTESVTLSELHEAGRLDLEPARAAMYGDTVARGWFSDRGRRDWSFWLGAGLMALGVVLVPVLAFTIGHALLGVVVLLAGAAVFAVPRLLPIRTGRGRLLVGQIKGLLNYLHTARAEDLPAADQEMVFSRSLPYAVVLGEIKHWLEAFRDLDPAADQDAGIYWFGGFEGSHDLHRFSTHFPHFVDALEGLLAETAHLSALRAPAPTG